MEPLDRVYSAFTNLEANFKRSKKSRSEYIADKFGGDIDIGSMVILDSLASKNLETPEEIAKLSTIRNIFAAIKKRRNSLDSLTSFNFLDESGVESSVASALDSAFERGTGICAVDADGLGYAKHYSVLASGIKVLPIAKAERLHVYNQDMMLMLKGRTGLNIRVGDVLLQSQDGHITVS